MRISAQVWFNYAHLATLPWMNLIKLVTQNCNNMVHWQRYLLQIIIYNANVLRKINLRTFMNLFKYFQEHYCFLQALNSQKIKDLQESLVILYTILYWYLYMSLLYTTTITYTIDWKCTFALQVIIIQSQIFAPWDCVHQTAMSQWWEWRVSLQDSTHQPPDQCTSYLQWNMTTNIQFSYE